MHHHNNTWSCHCRLAAYAANMKRSLDCTNKNVSSGHSSCGLQSWVFSQTPSLQLENAHDAYQHAERMQSAGKDSRQSTVAIFANEEPDATRSAQISSAGRRLTSRIRAASCLELCVPCLPVTRFTDFELLILLLLELRLVAKHAELSKPNRASALQRPNDRLNML